MFKFRKFIDNFKIVTQSFYRIMLNRLNNTVKIDHNELGYKDLPVIMNKFSTFFSVPKSILTTFTNLYTTNSQL